MLGAGTIVIALATACSGDGADAKSLDCDSLAKDRPYHYQSIVTYDLAERPPGAPPEQVHDYGPEGFELRKEFNGALEAPDKIEALIHQESSVDLAIRVVGNQAWTQVFGDPPGEWQATPLETAGELFPPEQICALLSPDISLEGAEGQTETVNGVEAVHYSFRSVPSQLPASLFGPQSDFAQLIPDLDVDVWVAERNHHPVRLSVQGTGQYENKRSLTLSISSEMVEVRDDSVKIDPP